MREITYESVVERIIQHKVQPSAVYFETTTECVIPCIARVL